MAKKTLVNPWIPNNEVPRDADPAQPQRTEAVRTLGPSSPQTATVTAPSDGGLPIRYLPPEASAPWWWVGCHGGAGVTTLRSALRSGSDAERHWPVPADGSRASVVLVTRTHVSGLRVAQSAARQWAAGAAPVHLLGLVIVADAPGKLPRPLQDLVKLVTGGYPKAWAVPWVEDWRLGESLLPAQLPKPVARLAADLFAATSRSPGDTQ
ncbi:DUF6668 family protein [Embleya sp. NBC_00896]|uniref:DUF6668 family protein n=1 Tax=Embleya sp. NBC_00896 TaxID=2975961 RepID=UPI0038657E21